MVTCLSFKLSQAENHAFLISNYTVNHRTARCNVFLGTESDSLYGVLTETESNKMNELC